MRARLCKLDCASMAQEQRHANALFKGLNLSTDSALSRGKIFGGSSEI
jgi:hypothetical protein